MSEFGKGQINAEVPWGHNNLLMEPRGEGEDRRHNPSDEDGRLTTSTSSKDNDAIVERKNADGEDPFTPIRRPNETVTLGPFTTSQPNVLTNKDYHPVVRFLIALDWSDGTWRGLLADILAGITLALSQVAPSVAFSIIAHMNPINGLYASFVQGFVMAFVGGRPGLLSGPPGSMVVLYPELVDKHGPEALYAACILTGVFMLLPGVLCLAKYVRVLPLPVMIGFVNGLGVILAKNQVNSFKDEAGEFVTGSRAAYSALLCIVAFAVIIFLPRVTQLVPSPFVALIVGAAIEHIFGLGTVTVKDLYVLSGDFPTPKVPDLSYSNLSGELVTDVLVVAVLSFIVGMVESLMMVHLLNNITGTHGNFEVESLGIGAANILTGFFRGFAGCGLVGPSILNVTTGGGFRRVSSVIYSVGTILIVVVASPAIDLVPMPVLASVVFYVSYKTFDWNTFEMILFRRIPLMDSLVIVVVVVVTLVEDLAIAVACGFGLALLTFFYDMAFGAHCIGICRFKKRGSDSCCKKCCWCLYSAEDDDDEDGYEMGPANTCKGDSSASSEDEEELLQRQAKDIQRTGIGRMFISYSSLTANPFQPLPQTLGVRNDSGDAGGQPLVREATEGDGGTADSGRPRAPAGKVSHVELWEATRRYVAAIRSTTDAGSSSPLRSTMITVQANLSSGVPPGSGLPIVPRQGRSFHHHAVHHQHTLHHSHPRSGLLSVEIHQAPSEVPGVVVLRLHCVGTLFFGSTLAFQHCCDQVLEDLAFAAYRRDVLAQKRARKHRRQGNGSFFRSDVELGAQATHQTQEDLLGRVTDVVFDCGYGRMTLHDSSAIDTIQEVASKFARRLNAEIQVPVHDVGHAEEDLIGVVSVRVPIRSHVQNLDRQSELLIKRSRPLFMGSVMHDNLRKRLERSEEANVCFIAAHNVVPTGIRHDEEVNIVKGGCDDGQPTSSEPSEQSTRGKSLTDEVDDRERRSEDEAACPRDPSEAPSIVQNTPPRTKLEDHLVIGMDVYSATLRVVVPVFATLHEWRTRESYRRLIHAGLDIEVEEVAAMYFSGSHPLSSVHVHPSLLGDSDGGQQQGSDADAAILMPPAASLEGGHHRLSLYDYARESALPWYQRIFTHKTIVRIPELSEFQREERSSGASEVSGEALPDVVVKHVRPLPLFYKVVHSSVRIKAGCGSQMDVTEYVNPVVEEKHSLPDQANEDSVLPSEPLAAGVVPVVNDPVLSAPTNENRSTRELAAYEARNAVKRDLFRGQVLGPERDGEGSQTTSSNKIFDKYGFTMNHTLLETGPVPKPSFMDWLRKLLDPTVDAGDIGSPF